MNKYQMEVIGMTIEEFKNEIVADVKDYATDTAKTAFLSWVKDKVVPAVKEIGNAYSDAVKASVKADDGAWIKFRDALLIPAIISVSIWGVEQIVDKATAAE